MSLTVPKVRKYGAFTGADFTNATPEMFRCPYLRNMYKDYTAQNGIALETRPGFRKLDGFTALSGEEVREIKFFSKPERKSIVISLSGVSSSTYNIKESDANKIIEVGTDTAGEEKELIVSFPNPVGGFFIPSDVQPISLVLKVWHRNAVKIANPLPATGYTYIAAIPDGTDDPDYRIYFITTKEIAAYEPVYTKNADDADFEEAGEYIITNKRVLLRANGSITVCGTLDMPLFYTYNGVNYIVNASGHYVLNYTLLEDITAYVPVTVTVDSDGLQSPFQTLNVISNTYAVELSHNTNDAAAGSSPQFFYTIPNSYGDKTAISVKAVYKNGVYIPYIVGGIGGDYQYKKSITVDSEGNYRVKLAFNPDSGLAESDYSYIGFTDGDIIRVELTYADSVTERYNPIKDCTITEIFENKVFFSGNPKEPNKYFWTALNDPTYVPIVNYEIAGNDDSKINALMAINDTLYALKDNGIYAITEILTGTEELAATYPNQPLRTGIGCLGAVTRFEDDPVFMSKQGLKAIGRQSVYYERAIEHRSTFADGKMLSEDLAEAKFVEWRGYLGILFPTGNLYLADSRQIKNGQYEWFLWTDIGLWDGETNTAVYDDEEETILRHTYKTGGTFNAATAIAENERTLYFTAQQGTDIYLCQFNTDILRSDGALQEIAYADGGVINYSQLADLSYAWVPETLNGMPLYGRAILCGLSTIRDNAGTYALTKTLNKKGFAILMKSFVRSGCKVRYKIGGDTTWHEMSDMYSTSFFEYETIDWADTSYNTDDRIIIRLKKKVKKFDDISFLIYNDTINKPFGIYEMQAEFYYGGYGK